MTCPRAATLLFLILLAVAPLGGLIGCNAADLEVSVQPDQRVFTLFAGLAAVGYGEGLVDPASEALRTQLKETLSDWTADDLQPMTSLKQSYELNELVSTTLRLGPPPDFAAGAQEPPPGLRAFLARLWTKIGPLYDSSQESDAQALAAMADQAAAVVQGAVDYAGGKAACKTWNIVADRLVLPGSSSSHLAGETAWIVLSPAPGSWQIDLSREAFRVIIQHSLAQLASEGGLAHFEQVQQRARPSTSLVAYVEDNLVRALSIRATDSADPEGALDEAAKSGFVLAPSFYEALADYESSGMGLAEYLNALLTAADIERALALVSSYAWERVEIPWGDHVREAWIVEFAVPGVIVVNIRGACVGLQADGRPLEGWWSDQWEFCIERGASRLPDWSGIEVSAGARLVVFQLDSWTAPEEPPPLVFEPK